MGSSARATVRYDGPALADHEIDIQDLAPALLALAELVQVTNRKLNGSRAPIRVLVRTDIEQQCFQLDVRLVQSLIEQARTLLGEDVTTAEQIARIVGLGRFAAGSAIGIFQLLKKLLSAPGKAGATVTVKRAEGETVLVTTGDGNQITVDNRTYILAADPEAQALAKKVFKPLASPGIDSLEFEDPSGGEPTFRLSKAEAVAVLNAPPLPQLDDEQAPQIIDATGPLRIKTAQYEGSAKWSASWAGKTVDVSLPPDWVAGFQAGAITAPPGSVLSVRMKLTVPVDKAGAAAGPTTYEVVEVLEVSLPLPSERQSDFLD